MRVRLLERLGGKLSTHEASVVLVEDQHGQVIQIACEFAPGVYDLYDINHPQFERALRALGIDQLVFVEQLHSPTPAENSQLLLGPTGDFR